MKNKKAGRPIGSTIPSEKRKKELIQIRVTVDEWLLLDKKREKANCLTMSEYIRKKILH
jgi:hypothetical protein